MSLINDALKRASRAPGAAPRALNNIALRPVETPDAAGSSLVRKTVPALLVIVVIMAAWFLWHYFQGGGDPVQARTPATAPDRPTAAAPTQTSPESFVAPTAVAAQEPLPATTAPALPESAATTKMAPPAEVPEPAPAPPAAKPAVTTAAPPPPRADPPAPAPTPTSEPRPFPALKLVGLSYHPTRGSALINGKFVFVGDRVEGARVTQISRDGVTLEFEGQTRTLSVGD
jgi:hypothetical protein